MTNLLRNLKKYRANPTADLAGRIPDQINSNGNMRISAEIIREINRQIMAKLAQDNNLIELNMLK